MKKSCVLRLAKLIVISGLLWVPFQSAGQDQSGGSNKTFDPSPDWRPTQVRSDARHLGNSACAECHNQIATQPTTPMGEALEPGSESHILQQHPQLAFKQGPYTYSISRRGTQNIFTVTNGQDAISLPVLYAFGQGKLAQTYLLRYRDRYYEGRVSFYTAISALDLTLGATPAIPTSLEQALGRALDDASVNDCFSCHATAAVSQGQLQLSLMTPGVTCEGCHGAGEKHVALMRQRSETRKHGASLPPLTDKQIFNPGQFDTEGITQFCGACHRSWIQVQMMGMLGVENVRFQPYRIFNSKCYDHQDKRISCIACHNPHEEIAKNSSFYDEKCLACHQSQQQTSQRKPIVCPRAERNCASCHMPKTELPGAHHQFTDHQIRIVRPGDPYPN